MTVSADCITANIRIKFDRKPDGEEGLALIGAFKDHGFKWNSNNFSWEGDKSTVDMFDDKVLASPLHSLHATMRP